jgi:hypothetical protein
MLISKIDAPQESSDRCRDTRSPPLSVGGEARYDQAGLVCHGTTLPSYGGTQPKPHFGRVRRSSFFEARTTASGGAVNTLDDGRSRPTRTFKGGSSSVKGCSVLRRARWWGPGPAVGFVGRIWWLSGGVPIKRENAPLGSLLLGQGTSAA